MKKISLWMLAAILICSTTVITTSCEFLLKSTLTVYEASKVWGVWEVTENSSSVKLPVGTSCTFETDNNLAYSFSNGETGTWTVEESSLRLTPKGKSQYSLGTFKNATKKELELELGGGTIKMKKTSDLKKK